MGRFVGGTEGDDFIIGTPEADLIDSEGGNDVNFGDIFEGDGSANDVIDSGEGDYVNLGDSDIGDGSGNDVMLSGEGDDDNFGDTSNEVPGIPIELSGNGTGNDIILGGGGSNDNVGDAQFGEGLGDDIIVSGEDDDTNTGNGVRDTFVCGDGDGDTVTDFNVAEVDIATPDCENV